MSIIRPASVQSILMFDSLSLQTPIKRCGVITLNPSKMKKNTFNVAFIIRRNQVNKDGKCAIMVRITVNGDYERVNSTLSIEPDLWDSTAAKAIGRTTKILAFNKRIEEIRYTIQNHYYELQNTQGYVTAEMVKNAYMGVTAREESLMALYEEFLADTKKMVGINRSDKTYQKYERCRRRVVEFMKKKYNITDIPLKELKPKFLSDFEVFLATEYNCKQNTVYKFLQLLRMVLIKAQREGISFPDPYLSYKMKQEKVDRGYLSEDEVIAIATKEISIKRLDQVRDVFIFACYTGLAYADIATLRADNIQKMFDGKLWIITHRQKTKTNVNVPLLPMAEKILRKYEGCYLDGVLLPVLSNQKTNAYLKEIADICGIEKNLTFHLARHTFATTMTFGKGVPIESVSKMLGHTNIQTTQIYARITNEKISHDMENLAKNLGNLDF